MKRNRVSVVAAVTAAVESYLGGDHVPLCGVSGLDSWRSFMGASSPASCRDNDARLPGAADYYRILESIEFPSLALAYEDTGRGYWTVARIRRDLYWLGR